MDHYYTSLIQEGSAPSEGSLLPLCQKFKELCQPYIVDGTQAIEPLPPITDSPLPADYVCYKCRTLIFGSEDLLSHRISKEGSSCTSYFLAEPLDWMDTSSMEGIEGKILCPKCAARIGTFCWAGTQCSCLTWVTPAFKFVKSKLDRKPR